MPLAEDGVDILVGVIETHDRPDLLAQPGGLEVLLDLVREFESKGPTYRQARQRSFKASYTNHYRVGLVQILEALELRSNNTVHRPVLEALELIKRYKAEHSPATLYYARRGARPGRRGDPPRPRGPAVQDRQAGPAARPADGVRVRGVPDAARQAALQGDLGRRCRQVAQP